MDNYNLLNHEKTDTSFIDVFFIRINLFLQKNTTNEITICPEPFSTKPTIIGKWSIITDSTFADVGRDNHPVSYAGQSGDYFDFRTDGKLYSKESMKMDTSSYQLTSDTTIIIPTFGITLNGKIEISRITNLTVHTATINAPLSITPGGLFGRKVNLVR